VDVTESADPEGLRVFYYLVQDLKALIFSLISLHFKVSVVVVVQWLPRIDLTLLLYVDQADLNGYKMTYCFLYLFLVTQGAISGVGVCAALVTQSISGQS
jgi:hypothetical protein